MLYKIGDFSKRTKASIRTLRYYDNIGLLKPKEIDLLTGYRYYEDNQIEDYKIIVLLKEVGFSLEEIIRNWNNLTNNIMIEKKKELLTNIKETKVMIRKIDYLRSNIIDGKVILELTKEKKENKKKTLFK